MDVSARARAQRPVLVGVAAMATVVGGGLSWWAQAMADRPAAWGTAFLAVAVAAALVQRFPLVLHVNRESLVYVLSELPLILGLFLLAPVEVLAARIVGLLAVETVLRRHPAVKIAANGGSYVLETGCALALFWGGLTLLQHGPDTGSASLALGLVSVVVATTLGGTMVWTAVSLSTGRFERHVAIDTLATALPLAVVNTALSLIGVVLIRDTPGSAWLLAVPAIVLVLGYRRYLAEREQRQVLGMLYALSQETHATSDLGASLGAVARTVRTHLDADRVELYLQRAGGGAWRVVSHGDGRVDEMEAVDRVPPAVAQAHATGQPVPEADARGRCTVLTYALDLGRDRVLALVARDPLSEVDGFRTHAYDALRSVATHARALIEDAELQDAKDSFLTSVSHELRTPLAVVLGAAETLHLQADRLSVEATRLMTERLHVQARRLDGLLRDLLDVDRLGRGLLEPSWRLTDVGALVERTVSAVDVQHHRVVVAACPVESVVDRAACERIVENLLVNATKYSPRGSTIRVTVAQQDDVVIEVRDEGPGIADVDKERVFEPFVRLSSARTAPGTGVGLSLVQRLVDMQGGTVVVEDAEPGARFVVTLPLRAEVPAPAESDAMSSSRG